MEEARKKRAFLDSGMITIIGSIEDSITLRQAKELYSDLAGAISDAMDMGRLREGARPSLPRWKCHKVVEAFKIDNIERKKVIPKIGQDPIGATLYGFGYQVDVTCGYLDHACPQPGGYYVRYDDGYESYSPAEAFEKGYTRLQSWHPGQTDNYVEVLAKVLHEAGREAVEKGKTVAAGNIEFPSRMIAEILDRYEAELRKETSLLLRAQETEALLQAQAKRSNELLFEAAGYEPCPICGSSDLKYDGALGSGEIKVPFGWWDLEGFWYPNPYIKMPIEDQRRSNIANGYPMREMYPISDFMVGKDSKVKTATEKGARSGPTKFGDAPDVTVREYGTGKEMKLADILGTDPVSKPPVGTIPEKIYEEIRAQYLAAAIHRWAQHDSNPSHDKQFVKTWADELCRRLALLFPRGQEVKS